MLLGDDDPIVEVLWEKKANDTGDDTEPVYVDNAIVRLQSGKWIYTQLKEAENGARQKTGQNGQNDFPSEDKIVLTRFPCWCQKLRDVGANRLICVSAKPFPRSIKDKVAKELGPTVLLVWLEALEAMQWPFQIVNNAMSVFKSHVEVDDTIKPNPLLLFHPDQNPFKEYMGELLAGATLPNVIRRDGYAELLPLTDLVNDGIRIMNNHPELFRMPEGISQVPLCWHPDGVSFCFDGQTAPIQEVKVVYKAETRCVDFPFEISSYTQEGHDTLAWVVRATGKVDDQDAEIRFTCVPDADGGFLMNHPQILGVKEGGFLFWAYSIENE